MSRLKKRIKSQKKTIKTISKKVKNKKNKKQKKNIISYEYKPAMVKLGRRGYDIIKNKYFVETDSIDEKVKWFIDFESYAAYVDNEIYNNACYYQCDISKIKTGVDYDRLNERKFFVEDTIYDYMITTDDEILSYNEGEKIKEQCKSWIDKFNACTTLDEFWKVEQNYKKSELSTKLMFLNIEKAGVEKSIGLIDNSWYSRKHYINFFMWQYIFSALNDKKRFDILMEYMSSYTCAGSLIREVCTVFNPDDVMAAYNFTDSSERGIYNQKKRLKDIVVAVKGDLIDKCVFAFFDNVSHYYCEKCTCKLREEKTCRSEGMSEFYTYRYFETFEDFIEYRQGDLTNCDLTKAVKINYDFSKCRMNDTTKLPLGNMGSLLYEVKKKYFNDQFEVLQTWYDSDGVPVKRYRHHFDYFFDFVAFLKGDLSNADLLLCDGLQNLNDITEINFKDAKITSAVCDKLGISYDIYKVDENRIESFSNIEENEKRTEFVLKTVRESVALVEAEDYYMTQERVYYVSDIHLLHKVGHFKSKSKSDVEYIIKSIVDNIVKESDNTILIGGDVSSDFTVFELFIKTLKNQLDSREYNSLVIFVLGNHELWEFPQNSFDEIVTKYRNLIDDCGMYLLQNNILYKDSEEVVREITTKEILFLENKDLREKIRTSRIAFFGGLAFSGYNEEFNANHGIYQDTIDRETEIEESKKFEELYRKVRSAFSDKNLVVLTHMPMSCWSSNEDYHKNFIYVNGHTHNNYFYDDGEIRVYADNQTGYRNSKPHMKWFDIENEYDYFADCQDGIYEITKKDYEEFYRGKNLMINFNREVNILFMLKKNGYYCFFHKAKSGSFTILNGGARKILDIDDINYYYASMDSVIALIKKPLDAYMDIQKAISAEIQQIGGLGNIHGCIIDIDTFNHVYVNPIDGKITGYFARDVIDKIVYPTVSSLLKKQCPVLYAKYIKLLKENSKKLPILKKNENTDLALLPQSYFDTDIYKASREIRKMQKLNSNILTVWCVVDDTNRILGLKSN